MHKKIRMVLYDSDGYMISLVNYLCRKKQEIVETRLFTDISMLKEFVRDGQADVLLAQEEEADWAVGLETFVPKIILLVEGNLMREQSDYIPVFRYQSAEKIVREVLESVAEDDRIIYTGAAGIHRQGELICGYSPFGGAGLSTYLSGLAVKLAQDFRTLYVCLEEFNGVDFSEKKKGQQEEYRGMSEVIFYLKQRRNKLALKIESLVYERDRVDYIPAVESYRDLYQLTRENIEYFLEILFQETPYEKFIFDVGYLGDAAEYLLEQSDKIYMPQPRTKIQERKQSACESAWERQGNTGILQKICRVVMGETGV